VVTTDPGSTVAVNRNRKPEALDCGARRTVAVWSLATLLFAACGPAVPEAREAEGVADLAAVPDTTLGPGDLFEIRVFGEKELSNKYRVSSDGSIDFPLIGTIIVDGKTPSEIAKLIEGLLVEGDFLKRPQVSILVEEYTSKKVSIFGQVKKPGTLPFRENMSVVEAISDVGGFTSMARTNDTTVIRVVDGVKKSFKVPVEHIGQGRAPNFILRPGDIVFVPERVF
jgi:polysaccharide export outer membrane protein